MPKPFKLSQLARRRWNLFRRTRRAYVSAWILGAVIVLTAFAELLCNNRPIVVSYGGKLYYPIVKVYAETEFGGIFDSETDYHDPFFAELMAKDGNWAIYPPIRFDYRYVDTSLSTPAPSPPDGEHLLGTDDRSRDVFARLVYGLRLSLFFGVALAVFGTVIGSVFGAVQGFLGGRFDLYAQRVIEVWSTQNELYLLIILSSIFEASVSLIFVLLSLFGWMGLAAYVRAEFLRARQYEYVQSAIALGAGRMSVMFRHILPNAMTPVITFFPFRVAAGITGLTALDFLGLGVPPPTPSLGELLKQGTAHLTNAWISVSVVSVLIATIMLLTFIGEGAQKAMDPKAI